MQQRLPLSLAHEVNAASPAHALCLIFVTASSKEEMNPLQKWGEKTAPGAAFPWEHTPESMSSLVA